MTFERKLWNVSRGEFLLLDREMDDGLVHAVKATHISQREKRYLFWQPYCWDPATWSNQRFEMSKFKEAKDVTCLICLAESA